MKRQDKKQQHYIPVLSFFFVFHMLVCVTLLGFISVIHGQKLTNQNDHFSQKKIASPNDFQDKKLFLLEQCKPSRVSVNLESFVA